MQLTTHTDYALRLLIYLMSHRSRKVSTREVAEAYAISLHHLAKVAKLLTKGGWLIAARGAGGGLLLAPHTPKTPVGEVVRYTEFTCHLAECFDTKNNTCPINGICHLQPILYQARRAFFDVLDSVTIGDLAQNPHELHAVFSTPRSVSPTPLARATPANDHPTP